MVAPSASPEPAPAAPGSLMPAFQEPAPPAPISPETPPSVPRAVPGTALPTAAPATPAPPGSAVPLVIIDGANVMGSVPDGWWRDRAGAAIRLRDRLADLPGAGVGDIPPPVEVVLVVEGKARDIPETPGGIRVERAPASGDDTIIELVRARPPARRTVVVTADRALKDRAHALGAETRGPSAVPR